MTETPPAHEPVTVEAELEAPARGEAPGPPPATITVEVSASDFEAEAPAGAAAIEAHLVDHGEIARGGMGAVHRVFDRHILRYEAMKVAAAPTAQNPTAAMRFLEEAQITGQLDHPNIVPVYGVSIDEVGRPRYFTMKLVEGDTLQAVLERVPVARRSGRELERLLRILLKVCDAVGFAHSRGVVHRDLKPENIIVGTFGQVYVMDWGCAKLLSGTHRSADEASQVDSVRGGRADERGMVIGTLSYMAPEQARALTHLIDERTDVYALGAIVYRILTNVPPHRAADQPTSLRHAQAGEVRDPSEIVPDLALPPELCRIALKAMAKDPGDRYPTAEAFASDIESFLRGGAWFAKRTALAGTLILCEGDEADAAYMILRGRCEAYKIEGRDRVVLREMHPGDVFGEAAIFTAQPRTASVVALDDVDLLVITRESLERELAEGSWLGALVRALATRFRDLDAQLSDLRRKGASAARAWIDAHLGYQGTIAPDGAVEASFSALVWRAEEAGIGADDLGAAIRAAADLDLDEAGDAIRRR